MKLLALDTSTEACSAALYINGGIEERFELTPGGHGRRLLPMINALLEEAGMDAAGLDALAFGRGPGGFTGVRIATGVVQGLALGLDLPVVPVSSLAALAQAGAAAVDGACMLAAIDARMNEVYWGAYRRTGSGLVEALGDERVDVPGEVTPPAAGRWWGVGSGWATYADTLAARVGAQLAGVEADCFPRASAVAVLAAAAYRRGGAVPVEQVAPVYLRDRVARKPGG